MAGGFYEYAFQKPAKKEYVERNAINGIILYKVLLILLVLINCSFLALGRVSMRCRV